MKKIAKTLFVHQFSFADRIKKAGTVSWELTKEKDPAKADMTLLPCPCCGSEEIFFYWYRHMNKSNRIGICCANCMLRMDSGTDVLAFQARKRWNRRVNKNETQE